jgi:uncharacterized protein YggE
MMQRRFVMAVAIGVVVALATGGAALGWAATESGSNANASSADATGNACGAGAPKLTVEGIGTVDRTPNLLTVSVGIDVTDSSAQASLTDDDNKAAAVVAALKTGGILDKDVQTSNLSIEPQYNDHQVITGYQVANELTAQIRDFSNAGSVIDALASAAGNAIRIDSLTFSVDDPRAMEDQARDQAVHQAVSHARSMAQAAGESLGAICSLNDNSVQNPYPQGFGISQNAASGAVPRVPLQPGTQQASADVTIVYSLSSRVTKAQAS